MRKLAALLLICGCQGEQVGTTATDAATDAAMEAGPCDLVAGNLIPDGSFEQSLGAAWGGGLEVVGGGADHCQRWAKLTTTEPWAGASKKITLQGESGDVFEFGASLQRLDEFGAPTLALQNDSAVLQTNVINPLPSKSTWVRVRGSLKLDRHVDSLTIALGANGPDARILGIDNVWLIKK